MKHKYYCVLEYCSFWVFILKNWFYVLGFVANRINLSVWPLRKIATSCKVNAVESIRFGVRLFDSAQFNPFRLLLNLVFFFYLCLGEMRNQEAGSSLLGQNHDNPGLHGKFVVFLEKHFMHSRCSLRKQISKSQSQSKNVFLKSKGS